MNNIRILTALELRSFFGINRFLHTRDKRERKRFYLLGVVWALLMVMAAFYVGALVWGLWSFGMEETVPAYLAMLGSLLVFALGLFQAGHRIFGQKGFELLSALPVKPSDVVVSRFLALYLENVALTGIVMVPGTAVYGLLQRPGLGFYGGTALVWLLLPAIPLVASGLLGTLILAASARMKHKSLAETALTVVFVVGILLWSFTVNPEVTPEMLQELAKTVGALIGSIYPPAVWMGKAMQGGWMELLLVAASSLAALGLTMALVSRLYLPIMGKLQQNSARHDYKMETLNSRGLGKALLLREAKRYFSSGIYVTNTIVGPIMGTLLAGAVCFGGLDGLTETLPVDIGPLIPFAFSAVFTTMTTTAVSISMEGRQFWVIQSLPIPVEDWLRSKILLNLGLMAPFYLVSQVLLVIGLKPGAMELVWLMLIPAAVSCFAVVLGIEVNLKLHRFDWEKEEQVVKQSASAALGGFAGLLTSAVLGAVCFLAPTPLQDLAKGVACGVLVLATAGLYRRCCSVKMEEL